MPTVEALHNLRLLIGEARTGLLRSLRLRAAEALLVAGLCIILSQKM